MAQSVDPTQPREEAGIQMMNDRMLGNRWKVFRGGNDGWLEEYRLYHRDTEGRLVKKNDDAISASRYALMMLRFASVLTPPKPRSLRRAWGGWQAA